MIHFAPPPPPPPPHPLCGTSARRLTRCDCLISHQCLCQGFSARLLDSPCDKLLPKKHIHGELWSTDAEGRIREFTGVIELFFSAASLSLPAFCWGNAASFFVSARLLFPFFFWHKCEMTNGTRRCTCLRTVPRISKGLIKDFISCIAPNFHPHTQFLLVLLCVLFCWRIFFFFLQSSTFFFFKAEFIPSGRLNITWTHSQLFTSTFKWHCSFWDFGIGHLNL